MARQRRHRRHLPRNNSSAILWLSMDLVERLVLAVNAHDATAFAGAFTDDGAMYDYPDQLAGQGRDQIRDYIGKLFAAFPLVKVDLIRRVNLGVRQITHERFDRGDRSPIYEAVLVYTLSETGISRLDFIRELREG
jgi:hypothetical protein